LGSLGGSREEEGFALRVFAGGLRGDGGGFGVIFERAIEETARRRRVCKRRDSTEGKEIEEQGGLAEKMFRKPKRRKEKQKQRKHPTTYAPNS